MIIISSLKEYFIVIFSTFLAVICLFLGYTDPIYLITGYLFFGIVIFWITYVKGLLGIHIPKEMSDDEKNDTYMYYSVDKWSIIDNQKYQWIAKFFLGIFILWIVFTVVFNGLGQMKDLFDDNINSNLDILTRYSWFGLACIISLVYLTIIIAFLSGRLPNELKNLFKGFSNRLVLVIGLITFIIAAQGFLKSRERENKFHFLW